jgi:hypothetical protein
MGAARETRRRSRAAFARLNATNFRYRPEIMDALFAQEADEKK